MTPSEGFGNIVRAECNGGNERAGGRAGGASQGFRGGKAPEGKHHVHNNPQSAHPLIRQSAMRLIITDLYRA
eukprot:15481731-Alexandrium_andersonii.AAC.1